MFVYSVIANKLKPLPYLEALLQKDEDAESEELEDEKRLKQQQQSESQKSDLLQTGLTSPSSSSVAAVIQQPKPGDLSASYDTFDSENMIDNPYLRPIVMPKLKVTSKKSR